MAQEATMNYSSVPECANLQLLGTCQQVCTCEVQRTEAPGPPCPGWGGKPELVGGPGKPSRAGCQK